MIFEVYEIDWCEKVAIFNANLPEIQMATIPAAQAGESEKGGKRLRIFPHPPL